jgi:hypothetical protein
LKLFERIESCHHHFALLLLGIFSVILAEGAQEQCYLSCSFGVGGDGDGVGVGVGGRVGSVVVVELW